MLRAFIADKAPLITKKPGLFEQNGPRFHYIKAVT